MNHNFTNVIPFESYIYYGLVAHRDYSDGKLGSNESFRLKIGFTKSSMTSRFRGFIYAFSFADYIRLEEIDNYDLLYAQRGKTKETLTCWSRNKLCNSVETLFKRICQHHLKSIEGSDQEWYCLPNDRKEAKNKADSLLQELKNKLPSFFLFIADKTELTNDDYQNFLENNGN